ncbi:MAG: response regulator [Bacteroidetes bacterium]|nr:response regulator [Bacteroidota bacterium]
MQKKIIMIIDDNPHDNFFTKRVIKQNDADDIIITMESAVLALEYLEAGTVPKPDLIFLDIYMPVMDGWEFLDRYCKLDADLRIGLMIVMLATSGDPAHVQRAKTWDCISEYIMKPLTIEKMEGLSDKYFVASREVL